MPAWLWSVTGISCWPGRPSASGDSLAPGYIEDIGSLFPGTVVTTTATSTSRMPRSRPSVSADAEGDRGRGPCWACPSVWRRHHRGPVPVAWTSPRTRNERDIEAAGDRGRPLRLGHHGLQHDGAQPGRRGHRQCSERDQQRAQLDPQPQRVQPPADPSRYLQTLFRPFFILAIPMFMVL